MKGLLIFQLTVSPFLIPNSGYLTTPIQQNGKPLISLELVVKAKLIDHYGEGRSDNPLNIVSIIDGARSIRCRLESLFGPSV